MNNNPPRIFWHRMAMPCGTIRHKLYVGEEQTPYFIDSASSRAHYSNGFRIGLWGAGMSDPSPRISYRIAKFLGGYQTVELAKHAAEQRALL